MKRLLTLFITTVLCGLCLSTLFVHEAAPPPAKFIRIQQAIPNSYIVVLSDNVTAANVDAIAADLARTHGGTTKHIYKHALKGFSIKISEAAAINLSQDSRVKYVEEDAKGYLTTTDRTNGQSVCP